MRAASSKSAADYNAVGKKAVESLYRQPCNTAVNSDSAS
jgi:hypothetical protein